MKKVLAAILAIVYLATSSGAVINTHYCMGKIYSVDFSGDNKCSKCGMKHAKGCCESKVKVLKAQDTHHAAAAGISFETPVVLLNNSYSVFNPPLLPVTAVPAVHNNSPPGNTSLYIFYHVFRI